jgi:tRNA-Thr(GGU) m(6)t(6)A37 methyltransferase TsaA
MTDTIPPKDYRDAVAVTGEITVRPIGVVRSPYTERHGTPRQARMDDPGVPAVEARIDFDPELIPTKALIGLADFDRVWVIAHLHLNPKWAPMVRPPRGDGSRKGVFATRAPHHPNSLGLSACQVVGVKGHSLLLKGVDLIDGTPVIDVKPYVPYCDAFPDSRAGWVDEIPLDRPERGRHTKG